MNQQLTPNAGWYGSCQNREMSWLSAKCRQEFHVQSIYYRLGVCGTTLCSVRDDQMFSGPFMVLQNPGKEIHYFSSAEVTFFHTAGQRWQFVLSAIRQARAVPRAPSHLYRDFTLSFVRF